MIDRSDQILEVNNLWKNLFPIKHLPNTNWTHKLDIQADRLSGRWLYNKEGYLAKLNKKLKPMFKVNNPDEFNKIVLGF